MKIFLPYGAIGVCIAWHSVDSQAWQFIYYVGNTMDTSLLLCLSVCVFLSLSVSFCLFFSLSVCLSIHVFLCIQKMYVVKESSFIFTVLVAVCLSWCLPDFLICVCMFASVSSL